MKHRNDTEFNAKLYGKQKFGFRKLSVGLAAVALGTTFLMSNGELVHADTTDAQNGNQTEEVKDNNTDQDLSSTSNAKNNNKETEDAQDPATSISAEEDNPNIQEFSPKRAIHTFSSKEIEENKSVIPSSSESVNTTTDIMNSDGSKTPVNGRNVMAENDNVQVNVHYQNDHLTAGQQIKVSYENSSDWTVVGWENGETKKLGDSFSAINNGDGSFTISSNIKGEASSSFDINFALQYAKNVDAPTPETLTVKTAHDDANNQSIISSSKFTPTIIPYEDKVEADEIAHGWASKATKSVNNNDDNSKDILNGTSATQTGQDRKLMQYMIEWNYGKAGNTNGTILSPLQKANFTARFSEGQTLLPDTIKVFRVYQTDAVKANGNRVDINSVYNDITKYDPTTGQFLYEDQAFEQFLKDHLTVTTTSNGTTKNFSWKDYQKALSQAKKDHTEPPMVNGLHLDENNMYHVKLSTDPENISHNFAENPDNNTNKSVATPHSTFFIQMDTLLDGNMPLDWTKPGNGPSITYNSVSGSFNGIGSNIKKSTSPIFEGGGNGFSHDHSYSATLHFADVNDPDKIISLDTGHDVTVLHGQNEAHATEQTPITFANAEEAIKTLEKAGYSFVGASRGTKTSGKYTGSDLYESSSYKNDNYGEYGDEFADKVNEYSWTHSFTLNFVKQSEKAHVRYYDDTLQKYIDDTVTISKGEDNSPIYFGNNDESFVINHSNEIISKGYKLSGVSSNESSDIIKEVKPKKRLTAINNVDKLTFGNFDFDPKIDQYFVVHFIHDTTKVSETKKINERVEHYYENGPHSADQNVVDFTQQGIITLQRTGIKDLVTNTIEWDNWEIKNSSTPVSISSTLPGKKDYGSNIPDVYAIDSDKITSHLESPNHFSSSSFIQYNIDSRNNLTVSPINNPDPNFLNNVKDGSTFVIEIPYKLHENITVHYIDEDNNDQEIAESKYTDIPVNNTENSTKNNTNKTIQELINEGYIFDADATLGNTSKHNSKKYSQFFNSDNKYSSDKLIFDNDEDPDDQNYYVYLYHNINHDLEEKTVTENIKYIDEATKKEIHDQYQTGKLTFTREIYSDQVTGKVTYSKWSVGAFKAVPNPKISGYTIDPKHITEQLNGKDSQLAATSAKEIGIADFHTLSDNEISALPDGAKLDIVVPYIQNPTPNPEPTQPTKPTEPTQPTQATTPETPKKPKTPKIPKKPDHKKTNKKHTTSTFNPHSEHGNHKRTTNTVPTKAERNNNVSSKSQHITTPKSTNVNTQENVNTISTKSTLPQTSEKQNKLSVFGLGVLALSALFGLADIKKRRNH